LKLFFVGGRLAGDKIKTFSAGMNFPERENNGEDAPKKNINTPVRRINIPRQSVIIAIVIV
jgi:hypothetical protein